MLGISQMFKRVVCDGMLYGVIWKRKGIPVQVHDKVNLLTGKDVYAEISLFFPVTTSNIYEFWVVPLAALYLFPNAAKHFTRPLFALSLPPIQTEHVPIFSKLQQKRLQSFAISK